MIDGIVTQLKRTGSKQYSPTVTAPREHPGCVISRAVRTISAEAVWSHPRYTERVEISNRSCGVERDLPHAQLPARPGRSFEIIQKQSRQTARGVGRGPQGLNRGTRSGMHEFRHRNHDPQVQGSRCLNSYAVSNSPCRGQSLHKRCTGTRSGEYVFLMYPP